jgi:hypothetical protein
MRFLQNEANYVFRYIPRLGKHVFIDAITVMEQINVSN